MKIESEWTADARLNKMKSGFGNFKIENAEGPVQCRIGLVLRKRRIYENI